MDNLIELTTEECLALLEAHKVGSLALQTDGGLRIYPLNYAMVQEQVVFRTLPYGQIANNAHGSEVAFAVDQLDEALKQGWHVLVVGKCERIEDPGEVRLIKSEMDPEPWAEGQRTLYFGIQWTNITGRQVGIQDRPSLIPPKP